MMKQLGSLLLALAATFGAWEQVHADPIPVRTELFLRGEAQVDPDNLQWQLYQHFITGGYRDLSGNVSASSNTFNGAALAFSTASATFNSAASGEVAYDETGFVRAIFDGSGLADLDQSNWNYTFTTQGETLLAVSYSTGIGESSSDTDGIEGFAVTLFQDDQAVFYQEVGLEDEATLYIPLDPNYTFTLMINPVGGISGGTGLGIATMWGVFDWQMD